eukprot:319857-Chlamydomonas_euryale.AAC.3
MCLSERENQRSPETDATLSPAARIAGLSRERPPAAPSRCTTSAPDPKRWVLRSPHEAACPQLSFQTRIWVTDGPSAGTSSSARRRVRQRRRVPSSGPL